MSSKSTNDGDPNGGENTKTTSVDDRVTAQELLDLYLIDQRPEMEGSTPRSHKSRLSFFVEWFEDETDYEYVDEINRTDILRFKQWRFVTEEDIKNDDDLTEDDVHATITISTQMDTLRRLLHWGERHGFLAEDLHVAAESPDTDDSDDIAHRYVDPQHVQDALEYLQTYEWGQRQTVVLALCWETAMRRSAVRALDVEDFYREDDGKGYLTIRSRPQQETRLKNDDDGDRDVAVRAEIADIIQAWIDGPRPNKTDQHGRDPLITTQHGRISAGCIQTDIYDALRPERIGEECSCEPDGEETCHANGKSDAYLCEDAEGPHAVRSTAITYHLNNGWPLQYVSDRADCSEKVIRKHYDEATQQEQMERREEFLDNL